MPLLYLILYYSSPNRRSVLSFIISILTDDSCLLYDVNDIELQVRASAVFALGTLLDVGSDSGTDGVSIDEEYDDGEKARAETSIIKSLLSVVSDSSPLVKAEVAVGL